MGAEQIRWRGHRQPAPPSPLVLAASAGSPCELAAEVERVAGPIPGLGLRAELRLAVSSPWELRPPVSRLVSARQPPAQPESQPPRPPLPPRFSIAGQGPGASGRIRRVAGVPQPGG